MFNSIFEKGFSDIVFVDTETTGLDPWEEDDRIIELAAVRIGKDGRSDEFQTLVRLPRGRSVPQRIYKLTGLKQGQLYREGIHEADALLKLFGLISEKSVVCAYNAQFDANMILAATQRLPEAYRNKQIGFWLDPLTVYKDRSIFGHRLSDAISHYGIRDVENTHRALDDIHSMISVMDAMEQERSDIGKYINVFGYKKQYGISGKKIPGIKYVKQRPMNRHQELCPVKYCAYALKGDQNEEEI